MDIHELLTSTPWDELSDDEKAEAEAHAESCEACAALLPMEAETVVDIRPLLSPPLRKALLTAGVLGFFLILGAFHQGKPGRAEASGTPSPEASADEAAVITLARKPRILEDLEVPTDTPFYYSRAGGSAGLVRVDVGGARGGNTAPAIPYREGRKLVRHAEVDIEVEGYDAFYAELAKYMSAAQAYLAGESRRRLPNGKTEATLTLRVPPEQFDALFPKLAALGTIRNQTLRTEDVTKLYVDLESRLKAKDTLAGRLRAILAEAKGEVKDLIEAETRLGATLEQIEQIRGEIKYYDNLTGYATVQLRIAERDLARPFEYVQTLAARLILHARRPEEAFAQAQAAVIEHGGQIVEAKLNGEGERASTASLRARIEAAKYPALREALRKLGHSALDRLDQQKSPRGGSEESGAPGAPVVLAQATLDLNVAPLAPIVTRRASLVVEAADVDAAYQAARRAAEAAGGKLLDGGLTGSTSSAVAKLRVQVEIDKFSELLAALKASGMPKEASTEHLLPEGKAAGSILEQAELTLELKTPAPLIPEESGLGRVVRETFSGSWSGFLWSVERLFVGAALATPWLLLGGLAVLIYRRRRKAAATA